MNRQLLILLGAVIALIGVGVEAQNQWYSACGKPISDSASSSSTIPHSHVTSIVFPPNQPSKTNSWTVVEGVIPTCQAFGYVNENMLTTGWSNLHIESNQELYLEQDVAFYAG
jgi:hypothetical protein